MYEKDRDLVESIAILLETDGDKTKASEFYERLICLDEKNSNALLKLADFRESIGDYKGAFEYTDKLRNIDPRNQYVIDNYEILKDKAENGCNFLTSLFKLFHKKKDL